MLAVGCLRPNSPKISDVNIELLAGVVSKFLKFVIGSLKNWQNDLIVYFHQYYASCSINWKQSDLI
jgi:hypothetical protein